MRAGLGLLLALLFTRTAFAGPANQAFVDRFHHLDPVRWVASDGWSNGPMWLNDWRRSQITTGSAGMVVTLDRNPASKAGYSSGEIQSRGLFRYGYYEVRMKAASGAGVDTGFFTYTGPPRGRPWNEIDIEFLGKDTRKVQLAYHTGNEQRATTIDLPFDAALESHLYGFDWQPNFIRWYIDGKFAHEETGAQLALPNEPQQIMLDLWNSNSIPSWMGRFAWAGQPIVAEISCISQTAGFQGNVIC